MTSNNTPDNIHQIVLLVLLPCLPPLVESKCLLLIIENSLHSMALYLFLCCACHTRPLLLLRCGVKRRVGILVDKSINQRQLLQTLSQLIIHMNNICPEKRSRRE